MSIAGGVYFKSCGSDCDMIGAPGGYLSIDDGSYGDRICCGYGSLYGGRFIVILSGASCLI